jgi:hypothetical protein
MSLVERWKCARIRTAIAELCSPVDKIPHFSNGHFALLSQSAPEVM